MSRILLIDELVVKILSSRFSRLGVSLYGDVRMAYDDTQLEHISKIEKKIPKVNGPLFVKIVLTYNVIIVYKAKGDDLCGSSTWKAAKGETSSKRNLDITGLEMMSCTHGTVVYSANLFKGETFKHTHLQHLKSHEMGTTFFCNDVVCKYWPFAIKVGHLFPEYQQLTKDVTPFLSRFHGLGHSWTCRVYKHLYFCVR